MHRQLPHIVRAMGNCTSFFLVLASRSFLWIGDRLRCIQCVTSSIIVRWSANCFVFTCLPRAVTTHFDSLMLSYFFAQALLIMAP